MLFVFILLNGCIDKEDKEIEIPIETESSLDFEINFLKSLQT
ncbi:hypothetical protein SAMN05421741_12412 [Paenimyroides ummariense]|uniref:Uncharacterized protein n=1 Tax=Paenimyroides ummariense TaxID=913024 RepID=A0A1I5F1V7_9FLAO|nr:hypothetical protein SAMN05421741_12412 [Paenimyroides ummariense]